MDSQVKTTIVTFFLLSLMFIAIITMGINFAINYVHEATEKRYLSLANALGATEQTVHLPVIPNASRLRTTHISAGRGHIYVISNETGNLYNRSHFIHSNVRIGNNPALRDPDNAYFILSETSSSKRILEIQTNAQILTDVIEIFSGPGDSAGRTNFALQTNGALWGWGRNDRGQLGNNTGINSVYPVKILDNVRDLFISGFTMYAMMDDGAVYSWGNNTALARNGVDGVSIRHTPVELELNNIAFFYRPYPTRANLRAVSFDGHSYIWLPGVDNEARSEGRYSYRLDVGRRLIGRNSHSYTLLPDGTLYFRNDIVGRNVGFAQFVGTRIGASLITKTGRLYSWGQTVGDGTNIYRDTPVHVKSNVIQIVDSSANQIVPTTNRRFALNVYGDLYRLNTTDTFQYEPIASSVYKMLGAGAVGTDWWSISGGEDLIYLSNDGALLAARQDGTIRLLVHDILLPELLIRDIHEDAMYWQPRISFFNRVENQANEIMVYLGSTFNEGLQRIAVSATIAVLIILILWLFISNVIVMLKSKYGNGARIGLYVLNALLAVPFPAATYNWFLLETLFNTGGSGNITIAATGNALTNPIFIIIFLSLMAANITMTFKHTEGHEFNYMKSISMRVFFSVVNFIFQIGLSYLVFFMLEAIFAMIVGIGVVIGLILMVLFGGRRRYS